METKDYIEKAAELADGWDHDGDELIRLPVLLKWIVGRNLPQHWLDALAAQLVRQVDAIDGIIVWADETRAVVATTVRPGKVGSLHFIGESEGPDRTMNTIKAIVDAWYWND